jgi:hypothetical protein
VCHCKLAAKDYDFSIAIQKTHKLCLKDDRYCTTKVKPPGKKARIVPCKALRLLADEYMLGINQQRHDTLGEDMKISDFRERYLRYCEEIIVGGRPRRKPSTVRGYKQVWAQHLKEHFGNRTLQQYQAKWGTIFLDSLTLNSR